MSLAMPTVPGGHRPSYEPLLWSCLCTRRQPVRTTVYVFGFTSDSLKTLGQVNASTVGVGGALYFPYWKSNMFVGGNLEATEKYNKESDFNGSANIPTT